MLWIVAANTNNCRIYHYQKHLKKLTLIKELDQPENRLKNRDMTTERPGHYNKSRDGVRGSYEPTTDAKENAIDHFAKVIAKTLNSAKQDRIYEKLILISDAHMIGLLKQCLDKNVHSILTQTIIKDLQAFSEKELLDYLTEHVD